MICFTRQRDVRYALVEFVLLFIGMIAGLGAAKSEIIGAHEMKVLKWKFLWSLLLVISVTSVLQGCGILGAGMARCFAAGFVLLPCGRFSYSVGRAFNMTRVKCLARRSSHSSLCSSLGSLGVRAT